MTTPKNERAQQDSSRSAMANQNPAGQNPGQQRQDQGGKKSMQQGGADLGKDPAKQDSTKRSGH